MRNLKRALSLLLSSTMVLGMVVMGGSAAGYQDVDASNNNQEAIEVLQAVGIMTGDENGNFNPDGSITRNEMAVVMAHLLNLDYDYYRGTNPFTDVPDWAAPYVAACAAEGVVTGIGNGMYGGSNSVTAAQASLMIMKALGYFQNAEDFGTDWQVATIRQASYINLFDKIDSNAESPLTRGQVAQLVLNGLKAKMVDFTGDKGVQIGDITVGYRAEYTPRANAALKYNTIDDGTTNINKDEQFYIQLGEELYNGELKLDSSTLDAFGRPTRTWTYEEKKVGSYVKDELLYKEYTTEVTGEELYELLGSNVRNKYEFHIAVDGETERATMGNGYFTKNQIAKAYDENVGDTGNGVLTQVYVDTQAEKVNISVINTYLAKAQENYDEKNNEVDLMVYEINEVNKAYVKTDSVKEAMSVSGEDFDIAEVAEDDLFLVTVADGEIQTMETPKSVDGATITNFKLKSYVTADGTQYDYADTVMYDEEVLDAYDDKNMKNVTYNVILDPYGYMIGIELVEEPDQYLFLTGIDLGSSNLTTRNADANVIFTDGTMKTVTVNVKDSLADTDNDKQVDDPLANLTVDIQGTSNPTRAQLNTWCTYTVDSDGVYTLEQVAPETATGIKVAQSVQDAIGGDFTIDAKNVSLDGSGSFTKVYGNDDTIYLTVDPTTDLQNIADRNNRTVRIIDDVTSVTTGVKNVKLSVKNVTDSGSYVAPENEVYTLYKNNGYVIAAVVIGEDQGVTTNYAYVTSSNVEKEAYDSDADEYTWTREAVVNGELVKLTEVGSNLRELGNAAGNGNVQQGNWYEVKYDANGNVRDMTWVDFKADANGSDDSVNRNEDKFAVDVAELGQNILGTTKNLLETYDLALLSDTTTVDALTYKNGTLYTDTAATMGFSVSPEVKVVLALAGKDLNGDGVADTLFDDVDDSYNGYTGLEKALRDMNANSAGFGTGTVEVNALFENGIATTIVINDTNPATNNIGDAKTPTYTISAPATVSGGTAKLSVTVTNAADCGTLTYKWYKDEDNSGTVNAGDTRLAETSNVLTINNVTIADNGQKYLCVITNTDTSADITGAIEATATAVLTLNVDRTASEYAGTINVVLNDSKSGEDKTTNAWGITSINYVADEGASAPSKEQILTAIRDHVVDKKHLTYTGVDTTTTPGKYILEFKGDMLSYYVVYDPATDIPTGTLTNVDAAGVANALNSSNSVTVNGNVTLDSTLDSKLTSGKTLEINGDVTLSDDVTLSNGTLKVEGSISGTGKTLDASNASVTTNFTDDVAIGDGVTVKVKTFTADGVITVASGATFDDYSGGQFPAGTGSIVFNYGSIGQLSGSDYINGSDPYVTLDTDDAVITISNGVMELTSGSATIQKAMPIQTSDKAVITAGATLTFASGASLTGVGSAQVEIQAGATIEGYEGSAQNFYALGGSDQITDAGKLVGNFTWSTDKWVANA